jgi:hypothetical protein
MLVCCLGNGLCDELITRTAEFYSVCVRSSKFNCEIVRNEPLRHIKKNSGEHRTHSSRFHTNSVLRLTLVKARCSRNEAQTDE